MDADLANNTLGWQWVAGCGADVAPYFRIFNPTAQAAQFDGDGTYARQWVKELGDGGAGEYPPPVVDHKEALTRPDRTGEPRRALRGPETAREASSILVSCGIRSAPYRARGQPRGAGHRLCAAYEGWQAAKRRSSALRNNGRYLCRTTVAAIPCPIILPFRMQGSEPGRADNADRIEPERRLGLTRCPSRAILEASPAVRGFLKRLLLVLCLAAGLLVYRAQSSQLAIIVLNTLNWGGGHLPSDWQVKVVHGKPEIFVCHEGNGSCLLLKSVKSSYGLEHSVEVNPQETRFLTWRWKVTQLPQGGDFRHSATDDQAAQVLVAFADRHILTYIWDTTAPQGTAQPASSIPLVHIFAVVCESGAGNANRWISEVRDVAADYQQAYGRPAPQIKGLRLQINSQHTGTSAESYFGEVAFRSTLQ